MSSSGVVRSLDGIEHITSGVVARTGDYLADPLGFQRREGALHGRFVPVLSDRLIEQSTPLSAINQELVATVLRAAVGVMQQRVRLAPPDRQHENLGDVLSGHLGLDRADDPSQEQFDQGGDLRQPSAIHTIGEVDSPFAVRRP